MSGFWAALVYVFLAEIGDKTQLMTLGFSARYEGRIVLAGVFIATGLINLISVALGSSLGHLLPVFWINLVAGLAFIIFGIWELIPEKEEKAGLNVISKFGPVITIATTFFLAELGDKTMLAAVAVASRYQDFWGVWAGSTLGLVGSNALAIVAGKLVKDRLSTKRLKMAVAVVYILSGLLALWDAFHNRI